LSSVYKEMHRETMVKTIYTIALHWSRYRTRDCSFYAIVCYNKSSVHGLLINFFILIIQSYHHFWYLFYWKPPTEYESVTAIAGDTKAFQVKKDQSLGSDKHVLKTDADTGVYVQLSKTDDALSVYQKLSTTGIAVRLY